MDKNALQLHPGHVINRRYILEARPIIEIQGEYKSMAKCSCAGNTLGKRSGGMGE
ncbi:hypothetical protein KIN20_024088 [Parelaphostrongylus tenuis]|uniref:Uncharacterized protein n=1 Tax=Parelaphostrongylus tenuis TaxID=148309 RepID=A0AAD5N9R0_PARTN|nr:hypothetical protein KIN20_024088 [Parelaphostrongylus tenuis]